MTQIDGCGLWNENASEALTNTTNHNDQRIQWLGHEHYPDAVRAVRLFTIETVQNGKRNQIQLQDVAISSEYNKNNHQRCVGMSLNGFSFSIYISTYQIWRSYKAPI